MGCWCETCGVTQLPINAGDKVRLFVLISRRCWREEEEGEGVGGGTCYSNDLWAPLGPPIQGKYDDYGGIESIKENADTKLLLERIKDGWIPFEEKYEEVSDIKDMTLSEVLHHIERDRAKTTLLGTKNTLGFMMVLEDVYQAMMKFDEIDAHHYEQGHYEYKPYTELLKSEIKNWYVKSQETWDTMMAIPNDIPGIQELRASMMISGSGYHRFFSDFSETGVRQYQMALVELIKKKTPFENKKVQALCTSAIEMTKFNRAMTNARKMWTPQCGKGGQHNEHALYKVINAASTKIMEDREKLDAEENEIELPDENGYYPYMLAHNLLEQKHREETSNGKKDKQIPSKKTR